jgi:hypothetical protein
MLFGRFFSGLLMLCVSLSPALAIEGTEAPFRLADMMNMPPQGGAPAGTAMPMGGGKAGMTPAPAPAGCCMDGMPPSPSGGMAGMPPSPPAAPGAMPGADGTVMPMSPAMMTMMSTMMAQMAKMQAPSALPLDRVEGRIAFLRAELGITAEQSQGWDRFAQALRSAQKHLGEASAALNVSSGSGSSVPDRLQAYEHHLTGRLESLKEARVSFDGLYETLTVAQRKTADELVAPILLYF